MCFNENLLKNKSNQLKCKMKLHVQIFQRKFYIEVQEAYYEQIFIRNGHIFEKNIIIRANYDFI